METPTTEDRCMLLSRAQLLGGPVRLTGSDLSRSGSDQGRFGRIVVETPDRIAVALRRRRVESDPSDTE